MEQDKKNNHFSLTDAKNPEKASGFYELVKKAPDAPGVYLMHDRKGKIIYIGKASSLKKRLSSYAAQNSRDMKTGILMKQVASVETILTHTEKEALILESNLIKKHKPRYNVVLKDDKRYPSLRLDPGTPFPTLGFVRQVKKDGALYFGPYTSVSSMRKTLKTIHRVFQLRKCRHARVKKRSRPCLNHQIGACLGPCALDVDPKVYGEQVKEVILFLRGRTPELIRDIKRKMQEASQALDFETAARQRDKLFALEKTLEKQTALTTDFMDRDVIGISGNGEFTVITVLVIRSGYLSDTLVYDFKTPGAEDAGSFEGSKIDSGTASAEVTAPHEDNEIIRSFIHQFYQNRFSPQSRPPPFQNQRVPAYSLSFVNRYSFPKEILLPLEIEDMEVTEERLSEISEQRVYLRVPMRGEKRRLVHMAKINAEEKRKGMEFARDKERNILNRLQRRLRLSSLPERIECFDNSSLFGENPVSAMVVYSNGKPDKSQYRKYTIKEVARPDDYGYMKEVLTRRYGKGEASRPFPDLLMVDGGKGQIAVAKTVLAELSLGNAFEVIGIAKKNQRKGEVKDKIYKPGRQDAVQFGKDQDLLLFLMQIRDEAHRFVITFHRKRRKKRTLASALDAIQGVGEKRKKALLRHFGGLRKLKEASLEEICEVSGVPEDVAKNIYSTFHPN